MHSGADDCNSAGIQPPDTLALRILPQLCYSDAVHCMQGAPITAQSNAYADHMGVYRSSRISVMTARGSSCFNFELYRSKNSLPFEDGTSLWDHFVQHGQFEGRTFE